MVIEVSVDIRERTRKDLLLALVALGKAAEESLKTDDDQVLKNWVERGEYRVLTLQNGLGLDRYTAR